MTRTATVATISASLLAGPLRPAGAAGAPAGPSSAGSGGAGTSMSAGVGAPASGPRAPRAGAIPTAGSPLSFPATPQPLAPVSSEAIDPLGAEMIAAAQAAERLGEQLKALDGELAAARTVTAELQVVWTQHSAKTTALREKVAEIANDAYKRARAMGPLDEYANDLQDLGLLVPALPAQHDAAARPSQRDSIGYEVAEAERAEQAAHASYDAAAAVERELAGRREILAEQFARHQAALQTLQARNAGLFGDIQSARDAYETSLSAGRDLASGVTGLRASPAALAAVTFALGQLGKPYEWAAEGPATYDCSGLVLASYLSAGIRLPRVARDQYGAGRTVPVSQLLPGDLLFFSTDRSDWRQVHHVAIYIGDGKMVHAPTFGQVVKISPIWWTEFFAATRVVPAIAGPGATTPPVTTPPIITPPPTTTPPTTPPPTTPPPTTVPPSTVPPTTAVPTTPPPSSIPPPTTAPPTTPPPTTEPATTPPPSTPPPSPSSTTDPASTTNPPTGAG